MKTQIEIVDGPLAGTCHEMAAGFPVPDKVGLPDGDQLHWYVIHDDFTATFERSDKRRKWLGT